MYKTIENHKRLRLNTNSNTPLLNPEKSYPSPKSPKSPINLINLNKKPLPKTPNYSFINHLNKENSNLNQNKLDSTISIQDINNFIYFAEYGKPKINNHNHNNFNLPIVHNVETQTFNSRYSTIISPRNDSLKVDLPKRHTTYEKVRDSFKSFWRTSKLILQNISIKSDIEPKS